MKLSHLRDVPDEPRVAGFMEASEMGLIIVRVSGLFFPAF